MKRRYDWSKLFGAGRFRLRRGRDYDCSQSSMVAQVRSAASVMGITPDRSIEITDREDAVEVIVSAREGNGRCRK